MTVVIIIAAVLLIYIAASCYIEIREMVKETNEQVRKLREGLQDVPNLLSAIDGWGAQLHDDLIRIEREMPPNGDNGVKE